MPCWSAHRGRGGGPALGSRPESHGSLYDLVVPGETRFKLRPAATVVVPERYGNITYRFNRLGYRDVDHDPQARRRRLVWLGDSVSFGLGVEQDRTYSPPSCRSGSP